MPIGRRTALRFAIGRAVVTVDRLSPFSIAARLDGDQAVLDVRGEVDAVGTPVLGAFFDAILASGYLSVLLDMSEMRSIDASGLAMTARVAGTLAAAGGHLTIRSSLTEIVRVLDLAWLTGLVTLELSPSRRDHLGPEETAPALARSSPAVLSEVQPAMTPVSSIPANQDVVDAVLRLVVALARATVGGADGASVTLRRHGRLATVAASDQTILDMDTEQYATGEGPCVDAAMAGRWFHAESLDKETRWPAFTPKARALGISAILSSPLLARERPMGALNIYSRSATAFGAEEQELAGLFAAEASNVLTAAGADVDNDRLATRVRGALRTREIIAEAQGIIMEREDISDQEAFDVLRRSSRASGRPLRDGAKDVVDSARHNDPDPHSGPSDAYHG
jgi:anti-anti-sigma factor